MTEKAGLDIETREMILDTIESVHKEFLSRDKILELDESEEFPLEIIKELLSERVGLQMVFIPEEYGGLASGAVDIFHVSTELAKICLGVSTSFLAVHLGAEPILLSGTEEQKRKWLGKIVDEGAIVAFAATESEAGSNLEAIKTKAEQIKDETGKISSYKLNGSKQFISNGDYADFLSVLAKAPEGPTFFIVEGNSEGFIRGEHEHKHGIRSANTAALTFENVIVPAENVIGGIPGKGIKQSNEVFAFTRLMVAAFGLGAGLSAMEKSIKFAKERVQFGSPLIEKQGYSHKLIVPHIVRLEAARAYIEEIANRIDSGDNNIMVEGSIAKYFATEIGNAAAESAIQAHGGYGYMHEYEVEKIKRDVRITTIYEGTSEIQQIIIYLFRWRTTVRSKGQYYNNLAREMEDIAGKLKYINAKLVGDSFKILNDLIMFAHKERLTHQQHIQFLLSDIITYTEVAAAFVRKVASLIEQSDTDADKLSAMLRIFISEVAQIVMNKGLTIVQGCEEVDEEAKTKFYEKIINSSLTKASQNVILDMDKVVEAL